MRVWHVVWKGYWESGWWRASVGLPESAGLKGTSRDWRVSCGRGERGES